ncbi:MAG: dTDP-4-dehydrorhamnose 3,5-epimerase family protein [Candidatus Thermoplasmatota archaeon]
MELIDGVKVKKLRLIPDERGWLMEILRSDDKELFEKFGQVYVTVCYPNVVKGWHYHMKQTDHFAVIKGMAKVVLYDSREKSKTKGKINEFFIGELSPTIIKIPPYVMHGFKAIGEEPAFVINVPTEVYNYEKPDEYRLPWNTEEINYDWEIKMG